MANAVHDWVVDDYLGNQNGIFVLVSEDSGFARSLRNIVSRTVGFKRECLFQYHGVAQALARIREAREQGAPCLVLVERMLGGRPSSEFIMDLLAEAADSRILLLTWEPRSETVALAFELGVCGVICKPASANNVIEKLAQCISPPSDIRQQMIRCQTLLADNRLDEALRVTDWILMVRPDSPQGLKLRGDVFRAMGNVEQAVKAYVQAHELSEIYLEPMIRLAEIFKDMDSERALDYLKKLDGISPLNADRKVDIGTVYLRLADTAKAVSYFDEGMEMASRELSGKVGDVATRIVEVVGEASPELAEKYLRRAIRSKTKPGPEDLVHFNRLGIVYRNQGKWGKAVETYGSALKIAPEDPVLHYNLGLAYLDGGERIKALESFEHALLIAPKFYQGHLTVALNIARLYLDLRQLGSAWNYLDHAMDIAPESTAVQRMVARARKMGPRPEPKRG